MDNPENEKLITALRNPKISAFGFLGSDHRNLDDIIEDDLETVHKVGKTVGQIAEKMQQITTAATAGLGGWVKIDDNLQAMTNEAKGGIVCPWPHPGRYAKRVTVVKCTNTNRQIEWSDLNIHLIAEHNFFQGKGSAFRMEPAEIIEILFQ